MKLKLLLILAELVLWSYFLGSRNQAGHRIFDDQSQNRTPVDCPGGGIFSEIRSGSNAGFRPEHADSDRRLEEREHAHRLWRCRSHSWSLGGGIGPENSCDVYRQTDQQSHCQAGDQVGEGLAQQNSGRSEHRRDQLDWQHAVARAFRTRPEPR